MLESSAYVSHCKKIQKIPNFFPFKNNSQNMKLIVVMFSSGFNTMGAH